MTTKILHQPVLLQAVIDGLKIQPGKAYIDCTIGSGGHSQQIKLLGGQVYGLDVDPEALVRVETMSFIVRRANFKDLKAVAREWGLEQVAGILIDLGLSTEQIRDDQRGFSWQTDAPLDMRADPGLSVSAADLINGLGEGELTKLLKVYGEEPQAKAIAKAITVHRPMYTTGDLVKAVARVKHPGRSHDPATLVFQALRIAVNDELNNLKAVLPQAVELLEPGGRLAVISFHSLEDRIVKNFMKDNAGLKIITKKPVLSAKPHAILRVAEKL
jgi:16S rRNA (cytosine1402-N4)-methyltransferase